MTLIIRKRLRAFIITRCRHWQIERQRVPAALIDTLCEDFAKQVDVRVLSMLTKADPLPREASPRKAKAPSQKSLTNHPTLL